MHNDDQHDPHGIPERADHSNDTQGATGFMREQIFKSHTFPDPPTEGPELDAVYRAQDKHGINPHCAPNTGIHYGELTQCATRENRRGQIETVIECIREGSTVDGAWLIEQLTLLLRLLNLLDDFSAAASECLKKVAKATDKSRIKQLTRFVRIVTKINTGGDQ